MGAQMDAYLKTNPIKKWIYEYEMWQHNNTSLLVAAFWSDNGIVKTLSNYHKLIFIAADGLMRKKIGDDEVREKHQSPINALMQNIAYSDMFHQVDKGNMIEAKYIQGKQGSKKHGY